MRHIEIINLINRALVENNINSFMDFEKIMESNIKFKNTFTFKDKQWLNNIDRNDSDVMLYLIEDKLYILLHEYLESYQLRNFINYHKPFDIYFIYGSERNYYIIQFSENESFLIALNKQELSPKLESEFIHLHVEGLSNGKVLL